MGKLARLGKGPKVERHKLLDTPYTVAAPTSCPPDCALAQACYHAAGRGARAWREMGAASPEAIAREEAALISKVRAPVLRLHMAGDCRTAGAARILAKAVAASRWLKRVWTYTHAWREVPRMAWGRISVLASVERTADADEAAARGYAPACTVETLPARSVVRDGWRWIPCPEQLGRARSCQACGLCLDADKLLERKAGILFGLHGMKAKHALGVVDRVTE